MNNIHCARNSSTHTDQLETRAKLVEELVGIVDGLHNCIRKVHNDRLILTFDGLEQWNTLVEWGRQAEKGRNEAVHVDTSQHREDSALTRIDA